MTTTPSPTVRAERLKERIYLAFAALAVIIALRAHHAEAGEALTTLAVTLLGTLLAVFTADILAHVVVHERPMTGAELRHAVAVSFGALGSITLPFAFLFAALFGWWETEHALTASLFAIVAALLVIGVIAVHRTRLPWWQRIIAFAAEALLGLAVIGLQVLAHG